MKARYKGPKELAQLRHRKALLLRVASIVALLIPIVCFLTAGFQTPIWMVCIFLAAARFLYLEFKSTKDAAVRAEKGGQAEDRVGEMLSPLKQSGWQIEQNVILPREGDVDFLVTSPNRTVFAIDVKSHAGVITEKDQQLVRDDKELERDFIAIMRRQAAIVSSLRSCGTVIPIIAFTRARLSLSDKPVDGVYVTKAGKLIETLVKLSGSVGTDQSV